MSVAAYAEEARYVRREGHLSDRDIARATGAGPSTVGAWVRGTREPSGVRAERLVELAAMVERLVRVVKPEYVPVWLNKPVPALDDQKPMELIAAGGYREVAKIISELEAPTFA
ncbi:MAG: helix-turn-helix domain-containing protein [Acidimicrobiales bacterium]